MRRIHVIHTARVASFLQKTNVLRRLLIFRHSCYFGEIFGLALSAAGSEVRSASRYQISQTGAVHG